ncbi:MAG: CRISPR-associated endonuclease Cas2 [Bacteroidaceae bacterium]|nr:CRISPR-associated endonuclease Cas2 [Bacteroidaceae bacterium]
MIVISYDIKDDKLRTKFSKLIQSHGAIRLQYSVYEVVNTQRIFDNMVVLIDDFCKKYLTGADSIVIFDVNSIKLRKYGNAIHRDQDIVYF